MTMFLSPVQRQSFLTEKVLRPLKYGSRLTFTSTWNLVKFLAMILSVVSPIAALGAAVYGSILAVRWSLFTLIPLSIPALVIVMWLVGVLALDYKRVQERNKSYYSKSY